MPRRRSILKGGAVLALVPFTGCTGDDTETDTPPYERTYADPPAGLEIENRAEDSIGVEVTVAATPNATMVPNPPTRVRGTATDEGARVLLAESYTIDGGQSVLVEAVFPTPPDDGRDIYRLSITVGDREPVDYQFVRRDGGAVRKLIVAVGAGISLYTVQP